MINKPMINKPMINKPMKITKQIKKFFLSKLHQILISYLELEYFKKKVTVIYLKNNKNTFPINFNFHK